MSSDFMNMGEPPEKKTDDKEQLAKALAAADRALDNQAKACEAAMIAAMAFDRLVTLLERVWKDKPGGLDPRLLESIRP